MAQQIRFLPPCASWDWTGFGVICVERVDAALTRQPRPDEGHGALRPEIAPVWEMVEAGIRQGETYAPSFYVLRPQRA